MPLRTKLQIAITLLAAVAVTTIAAGAGSGPWLPFWLLVLAVLSSSGLKVALPQGDGSMSLDFPFILLGIIQLSPLQAILLAAISVAAQCRVRVRVLFTAVQIAFNVCNGMLATALTVWIFTRLHRAHVPIGPALALASVGYFLLNTTSVAVILAPSEERAAFALWREQFPWYLPFYLVGAVLAATVNWLSLRFGWATALLIIPVVYTLYRAYNAQASRLLERQKHLEETEALHLRTIEGLAMAIEAKDQNTHDHLFRVRHYVKAVGQKLRLSKLEMQALETAAFLHDIGKLAVPEHIINKPGKLTPEEFEKMKIHPVVGADILERVRFPYPVVPIVRSHHEWWNGTGYPDGLAGEHIPIGARVLTVVDCFDALVSDRPYRKGLSTAKALEIIRGLSGRQFDPEVIAAFELCHAEAESQVENLVPSVFTPLNTEVEVARGNAPGAGYQAGSEMPAAAAARSSEPPVIAVQSQETINLLAVADQEAHTLLELSQSLGNSLSPTETLSVIASKLRRLIPFDLCAVHFKRTDVLEVLFLDGEERYKLTSERIPLGEGISGWVAQSSKPILNGNATVEPGCPELAGGVPALRSGLSIPLFDPKEEVFAVLTLYSATADSFTRDHLQVLLAMEANLSLSLQNSLQFRHTEAETDIDFLTGLPNARRLFLQLEAELDRQHGQQSTLAVLVCDLNDFRVLNDRKGHPAGNRLLRLLAESFRTICAPGEMVARLGGDEFVFLLPGAEQHVADARKNAIRQAVDVALKRTGLGVPLSVSIGAAFGPQDGRVAEELLACADRRLYLDKQMASRSMVAESAALSSVPAAACGS